VATAANLPAVAAEATRNIDLIAGPGTAEAVLDTYQQSRPGISRTDAVTAAYGDAQYGIPTIRVADAQSEHAKVWLYRLDVSIPGLGSLGIPVGGHGADAPILWGIRIPGDMPGVVFENDADAIAHACDLFTDAVRSFVTTGTPSTPELEWDRYDPSRRTTLIVDAQPHLEHDPHSAERVIWGQNDWLASTWFPIRDPQPMETSIT
jgi:para-nitrobenzyl esterase